ncbi:unnamed protein product [Amoebophrya sp. A25]|nr:unnamed protein product [Amoebophrya sp. A25]|eukprot:GSA25T00015404001.1
MSAYTAPNAHAPHYVREDDYTVVEDSADPLIGGHYDDEDIFPDTEEGGLRARRGGAAEGRQSVLSVDAEDTHAITDALDKATPEEEAKEEAKKKLSESTVPGWLPLIVILVFITLDAGKGLADKASLNGANYNVQMFVILVNIFSLLIAFIWTLCAMGFGEGFKAMFKWSRLSRYIMPAMWFGIAQALQQVQNLYLAQGTKKVLAQLRIPLTALFSMTITGAKYTSLQWLMIGMIVASVFEFQMLQETGGLFDRENSMLGLIFSVLASICAVIGSLVGEKIMKESKTLPFCLQKFQFDLWQTVFSVICTFALFPLVFFIVDVTLEGTPASQVWTSGKQTTKMWPLSYRAAFYSYDNSGHLAQDLGYEAEYLTRPTTISEAHFGGKRPSFTLLQEETARAFPEILQVLHEVKAARERIPREEKAEKEKNQKEKEAALEAHERRLGRDLEQIEKTRVENEAGIEAEAEVAHAQADEDVKEAGRRAEAASTDFIAKAEAAEKGLRDRQPPSDPTDVTQAKDEADQAGEAAEKALAARDQALERFNQLRAELQDKHYKINATKGTYLNQNQNHAQSEADKRNQKATKDREALKKKYEEKETQLKQRVDRDLKRVAEREKNGPNMAAKVHADRIIREFKIPPVAEGVPGVPVQKLSEFAIKLAKDILDKQVEKKKARRDEQKRDWEVAAAIAESQGRTAPTKPNTEEPAHFPVFTHEEMNTMKFKITRKLDEMTVTMTENAGNANAERLQELRTEKIPEELSEFFLRRLGENQLPVELENGARLFRPSATLMKVPDAGAFIEAIDEDKEAKKPVAEKFNKKIIANRLDMKYWVSVADLRQAGTYFNETIGGDVDETSSNMYEIVEKLHMLVRKRRGENTYMTEVQHAQDSANLGSLEERNLFVNPALAPKMGKMGEHSAAQLRKMSNMYPGSESQILNTKAYTGQPFSLQSALVHSSSLIDNFVLVIGEKVQIPLMNTVAAAVEAPAAPAEGQDAPVAGADVAAPAQQVGQDQAAVEAPAAPVASRSKWWSKFLPLKLAIRDSPEVESFKMSKNILGEFVHGMDSVDQSLKPAVYFTLIPEPIDLSIDALKEQDADYKKDSAEALKEKKALDLKKEILKEMRERKPDAPHKAVRAEEGAQEQQLTEQQVKVNKHFFDSYDSFVGHFDDQKHNARWGFDKLQRKLAFGKVVHYSPAEGALRIAVTRETTRSIRRISKGVDAGEVSTWSQTKNERVIFHFHGCGAQLQFDDKSEFRAKKTTCKIGKAPLRQTTTVAAAPAAEAAPAAAEAVAENNATAAKAQPQEGQERAQTTETALLERNQWQPAVEIISTGEWSKPKFELNKPKKEDESASKEQKKKAAKKKQEKWDKLTEEEKKASVATSVSKFFDVPAKHADDAFGTVHDEFDSNEQTKFFRYLTKQISDFQARSVEATNRMVDAQVAQMDRAKVLARVEEREAVLNAVEGSSAEKIAEKKAEINAADRKLIEDLDQVIALAENAYENSDFEYEFQSYPGKAAGALNGGCTLAMCNLNETEWKNNFDYFSTLVSGGRNNWRKMHSIVDLEKHPQTALNKPVEEAKKRRHPDNKVYPNVDSIIHYNVDLGSTVGVRIVEDAKNNRVIYEDDSTLFDFAEMHPYTSSPIPSVWIGTMGFWTALLINVAFVWISTYISKVLSSLWKSLSTAMALVVIVLGERIFLDDTLKFQLTDWTRVILGMLGVVVSVLIFQMSPKHEKKH